MPDPTEEQIKEYLKKTRKASFKKITDYVKVVVVAWLAGLIMGVLL